MGAGWRDLFTGFNGAALFQSGERLTDLEDCAWQAAGASMGPLFFRAENQVRPY